MEEKRKTWKRALELIFLGMMFLIGIFLFGVLVYYGGSKIIYKGVTALFGFASSLSSNIVLAVLGVAFWIVLYALALFIYTAFVYSNVAITKFFFSAMKKENLSREKLITYLAISVFMLTLVLWVSIVNIPQVWGYLVCIAYGILAFVCFVLCDGFKNIKKKKQTTDENQKEVV
jgi:hypothetical protein